MKLLVVIGCIFLSFVLISCDEESPIVDCNENKINLSASVLNETNGNGEGKITLSAKGGIGELLYSLNDGELQQDNFFDNLDSGIYVAQAIDMRGCFDTLKIFLGNSVVDTTVISFSQDIIPIINTNCQLSDCHKDSPNLPSFDSYVSISANSRGIKAKTISKEMPPPETGGMLTDEEIELIAKWVDKGAPNN